MSGQPRSTTSVLSAGQHKAPQLGDAVACAEKSARYHLAAPARRLAVRCGRDCRRPRRALPAAAPMLKARRRSERGLSALRGRTPGGHVHDRAARARRRGARASRGTPRRQPGAADDASACWTADGGSARPETRPRARSGRAIRQTVQAVRRRAAPLAIKGAVGTALDNPIRASGPRRRRKGNTGSPAAVPPPSSPLR